MRILTKEELIRLTGKRTRSAQVRALWKMRIDHRVNPVGEVIVIDADLPLKSGPSEPEVILHLDG